MKFWEAPEIHVLATPLTQGTYGWANARVQVSCIAGWNDIHGGGDGLAETAGRACYWSYGKGRKTNVEYLQNIIDSGHGSVLEHAHYTFGIRGISRSLTHELVRHRHLSFSQLSQRYVTEDPDFVVPPLLLEEGQLGKRAKFEAFCSFAAAEYASLLGSLEDTKRGRECARAALPNATATRLVVTGNVRALRQMLALRGSPHADAEFRRLAVKWTEEMKMLCRNSFADFEIKDGCVVTPNPKV